MVITKLTFLAGIDGIAKTPEWASTITGIPRERIVKLAREIATAKPAYISRLGSAASRQR